MDLVDYQLEDLIHQRKGLLGTQLLGEWRKALHVHKHDGDVSPLSLYAVSLREDLLSQSTGQILLNLGKLFIKGEVFRKGGDRRRGQVVAALAAKLFVRQILRRALGAEQQELFTTFGAKLPCFSVFCLALRALHGFPPAVERVELLKP